MASTKEKVHRSSSTGLEAPMARVSVNSKDYHYLAQPFNPNPPHFYIQKPTIIPIGFDCGPSVFLSGNLDDPKVKKDKKRSEIKQYNFYDLPFSTILTKHIPTVFDLILTNSLEEPLRLLEELKTTHGLRFSHIDSYSKEYPIDGNGTEYNQMFIEDMIIRIRNLQQIMEQKNNFKIFYRKSHSCCHHNSEYKYDTITTENDIIDSIALSEYLKKNNVNFKIVLFLCCNSCYGDKTKCNTTKTEPKGIIDNSRLFDEHNILCIKTLYKNFEESPLFRTIPKQFTNISYNLFKKNFQLNEETSFEKASEAALTEDQGKVPSSYGSRGRGRGSSHTGRGGRGGTGGRGGGRSCNITKRESKKNKVAYSKTIKSRLIKKQ